MAGGLTPPDVAAAGPCSTAHMMMFPARSLVALAAFAVPLPAMAQAPRSSAAPSPAIITAAKMRADLEFLASDALRGRLTNTPENAIALEWVKARFEWLGLRPKGADGSYFLPYDLSLGALGEGNDLAVTRGGAEVHYGLTSGFYPHRYSGSG